MRGPAGCGAGRSPGRIPVRMRKWPGQPAPALCAAGRFLGSCAWCVGPRDQMHTPAVRRGLGKELPEAGSRDLPRTESHHETQGYIRDTLSRWPPCTESETPVLGAIAQPNSRFIVTSSASQPIAAARLWRRPSKKLGASSNCSLRHCKPACPVNEAVEVTGVSRATLYRMLGGARQQQDLVGLVRQFEDVLARLASELDWPPLPADFERHLGVSLDEVFEMLMQLYRPLAGEANALGPIGLAVLGDLIPGLGVPEKIVLNMLMLQGLPLKDVARSTQLPETRVLGWAALALLRVLPELRGRCSTTV